MKKVVILSCFDWFDKRIEPIYDELKENADISILTSDFNHILKTRVPSQEDSVQTYIKVPSYKKNVSFKRLYSHFFFSRKVYHKLLSINPDVIYSLVPPNSLVRVCSKYKHKHKNCKLVFDLIDMWPESFPSKKNVMSVLFYFWKRIRDNNLKEADYLVTECKLYLKYLNRCRLPKKIITAYLYKNANIEDEIRASNIVSNYKRTDCNVLKLCYLGSINHIIDIESICLLIKSLKENYNVILHIIGGGEKKDSLVEMASTAGATVFYHGVLFDEESKSEIIGNCDFGLNLMKDDVTVGLTTKSIDYFYYGLPIINNIKGDSWNIVNEYKVGFNFERDKLEQAIIDDFFLTKKAHVHVREMYVTLFSRNTFMKKMKALVFDLLQS